MEFIRLSDNKWWELDRKTNTVFNFDGGHHAIRSELIDTNEICNFSSWHELYNKKHFCPLEVTKTYRDVWISPDGKFYNGEAHDNRAEELLEIIYGETDVDWAGDRLEELGWCRATTSLMWDVRLDGDYWVDKEVTRPQYDAIFDFCHYHGKRFPQGIWVD